MYGTHSPTAPSLQPPHLEGVVLRGHLDDEVVAEHGDLHHDVVAHARDLGEEEEGEEAGDAAKAGCEGAAVEWLVLWVIARFRGCVVR